MRFFSKKGIRKIAVFTLTAAVAAASCGCFLFDHTDYEMTDAGIYLARALKHHDADEIFDLDLDEAMERRNEIRNDLDFSENGPYMPGNAQAYSAICSTMRYYIEDGSVELDSNGRSGEATFIFEIKDYKQVRRERDNMSDPVTFSSALALCEDFDEVEVTMEFELDGGEWKVTNFNEVYDSIFTFLDEEFEFISPLKSKIRSLDWVDGDTYDGYPYYANVSSIELDLNHMGNDEGWNDVFYVVTYSSEGTEEDARRLYTSDPSLRGVYGSSQGASMSGGALPEGYYTITFCDGFGTVLESDTCYVVNYSY